MAEKEITISDKYRMVFSEGYGRQVLADILMTCHFLATIDPENQARIGEQNVGMVIAAKAGLLDDLTTMLGMERIVP